MTKHTPGPWRYISKRGLFPSVQIPSMRGRAGGICINEPPGPMADIEANARLIVAAPGLALAWEMLSEKLRYEILQRLPDWVAQSFVEAGLAKDFE